MLTAQDSRDNIDLVKDNFQKLYQRKAQTLTLLKSIADYYKPQGLDLSLPAHRNFITSLYYYNSQDLISKEGKLSPHQKYFYEIMHPSLKAGGSSDEAMQSFFSRENQKQFTFKDKKKIPFVIPKNMPLHLSSSSQTISTLPDDEGTTEISFGIKPLDLTEYNDFNSIQKEVTQKLQGLVTEFGIRIEPEQQDQAKKIKHKDNPDSIQSFYKNFEGLASYLLSRSSLTPHDGEEEGIEHSEKKSINVDVNPSSFFDTAPGLLRNLEYVDGAEKIYRTAALINNKVKTKISADQYGKKSTEELTIEGLATMSQFLKVKGAGPKLIITSLLSALDNELTAEHQATIILNELQKPQKSPLKKEDILNMIFEDITKDPGNKKYELNKEKYDYFAEIILENINQKLQKIEFKHVNIGSNVQDAVALIRTEASYTSSRIKTVLTEDLGIEEDAFNIQRADDLAKGSDPIDVLKALLIREYLNDEAQERDGITPRYFYAGILNALIEKTDDVNGSIHCESGKDRTSVVAAVASRLMKMDASELKAIYERSSARMSFFEEIQKELLEKNSATQKVMEKTETGMQGIKVGTFSAVVGALLFKGVKVFGLKIKVLDPQAALFIPRLLQPIVNLLNQIGLIGAVANIAKLKKISIKNLKVLGKGLINLPKILKNRFTVYSQHKQDFYFDHQKTLTMKSLNNFNSIFKSYAKKLKSASKMAYIPIILLGIAEVFSVQLPKVIGSVASLALESIAIGFKIPAQQLDKILGNQSPGFILNAIGYGLHAVSNVINNIFVHDFYNQIGSVSYEEEERFLYANLAAHSSAELRKKTGELMTKPADEEKIKAVAPSSTFYAANDFDKIPSFNPHAALKITFSDGVGVPHLANYSNSEGKSSWRIESGDDSLTLGAIQAKITTITANSAFSGFKLPDTSLLDESQQKNIALMHYAMLIEIKRCGDDKSALENLKFNFHFKDTGTIELCQQIASDLKEHTIKSLEARTPKAVALKQQKAAELGDDPSLMNSVPSTKTSKPSL